MDNDFDEWTPEEEAEIRRAMQDARDGFFYTMVRGKDGKLNMNGATNASVLVGSLSDRSPTNSTVQCDSRGYHHGRSYTCITDEHTQPQ